MEEKRVTGKQQTQYFIQNKQYSLNMRKQWKLLQI